MAYTTASVSSLSSIPALASAFAISQGWTVNTSVPATPIFTPPVAGSPIAFQLSAIVSGTTHDLRWAASGSGIPTSSANIRSPRMAPASGSTPVVPNPTAVHMFISPAPSDNPYFAIVVQYGPNWFRHLYLGVMEKLGNYSGGEVIAGCTVLPDANATLNLGIDDGVHHLFQGRSDIWADTLCGGVRVSHADNPNTWRKFRTGKTDLFALLNANGAFGGYCDSINDGPFMRSEAAYAGVNILNPVNLYATQPITGDMNFVPLGRPPGIRHVHMKNLDPLQSISIGSKVWRVFPSISKSELTTMPRGTANFRTQESSHWFGYAYPEN